LRAGASCELVWHHDKITDPPGERPDTMSAESHLQSRVTVCEPPHKLGFMFFADSEVIFELKPAGAKVLLTLTHRGLPSRGMTVGVSTGWHAHLDVLAARLSSAKTENFWDHWHAYKDAYEKRIPADA
jgi:Activator of Hsp90 ATPase homolog 1-like protein